MNFIKKNNHNLINLVIFLIYLQSVATGMISFQRLFNTHSLPGILKVCGVLGYLDLQPYFCSLPKIPGLSFMFFLSTFSVTLRKVPVVQGKVNFTDVSTDFSYSSVFSISSVQAMAYGHH